LRGSDGSQRPQSPFAEGTPVELPEPNTVIRVPIMMKASRG